MIRLALVDDLPLIMKMVKDFHMSAHANRWSTFGDSADHWEMWFTRCMEDEDKLCLIAEEEGDLVGMMTAASFFAFWNPTVKVAVENVLWVKPEVRGKGYGNMLIEALVEWSEKVGCHSVSAGSTQKMHPKAVGNMLRSHGFELEEKIYSRRIR